MIPYLPPPVWRLGGITISAFRIAAAAALLSGYGMALWRARSMRLNETICSRYYVVCVAGGLAGGHAAYLVARGGEASFSDWARIWNGQSAMGLAAGELVTLLAAYFALRRRNLDPWLYLNTLAFAFPFAWTLARAGCALAHDHIGRATDSFLGVRFPSGTRFDLGLLECLAAAVLAGCFLAARRTRRGVFLPALVLAAAAVRTAIIELRA